VFQKATTPPCAPQHGIETRGRNGMEACTNSSLLRYFCPPKWNSSAAHAGCQLCPQFWKLLGDQCYWLSKEKRTWIQSKKDCENQDSQLVVIRNKVEKEHIMEITAGSKQLVWIVLKVSENTWKWVDNSSFNDTLFDALPKLEKGCGALKNMTLEDDSCDGEHRWACQKKPFHLLP
ncbi:KLRBF protein, partial [Penelope pileata]|nr:KLRBF protein [Penelope pileata]